MTWLGILTPKISRLQWVVIGYWLVAFCGLQSAKGLGLPSLNQHGTCRFSLGSQPSADEVASPPRSKSASVELKRNDFVTLRVPIPSRLFQLFSVLKNWKRINKIHNKLHDFFFSQTWGTPWRNTKNWKELIVGRSLDWQQWSWEWKAYASQRPSIG